MDVKHLGVISDSHGDGKSILRALEVLGDIDILIFLGDYLKDVNDIPFDGTIYKVKGNCDMGVIGDEELLISINGYKIYVSHGHRYNVKMSIDKLYYRGLECGADIILYGHTHVPLTIKEGNIHIVNPGSTTQPRLSPFPTCARLTLDEKGVETEIISLEEFY